MVATRVQSNILITSTYLIGTSPSLPLHPGISCCCCCCLAPHPQLFITFLVFFWHSQQAAAIAEIDTDSKQPSLAFLSSMAFILVLANVRNWLTVRKRVPLDWGKGALARQLLGLAHSHGWVEMALTRALALPLAWMSLIRKFLRLPPPPVLVPFSIGTTQTHQPLLNHKLRQTPRLKPTFKQQGTARKIPLSLRGKAERRPRKCLGILNELWMCQPLQQLRAGTFG
jgi:hypothetical protein